MREIIGATRKAEKNVKLRAYSLKAVSQEEYYKNRKKDVKEGLNMQLNRKKCQNDEQAMLNKWKECLEKENELYFDADALKAIANKNGFAREQARRATALLMRAKELVYVPDGKWCVIDKYKEQYNAAECLAKRLADSTSSGITIPDHVWPDEEKELSKQQMDAVKGALGCKLAMITGYAGTGKTAVIRGICTLVQPKELLLCAPMGKAAKYLKDKVDLHTYTNDYLIYHSEHMDLSTPKVVIVDEAGMMNNSHLEFLLKTISKDACLILVGDEGQLPSVIPSEVMRDMKEIGVPTFCLTEVHRQESADTALMRNLMQCVQKSNYPQIHRDHTFQLIDRGGDALIEDAINRIVSGENVQVIAPCNADVDYLAKKIAKRLHEIYGHPMQKILSNGMTIWNGEKILIRKNKNNTGVVNGEVATARMGIDSWGHEYVQLLTNEGRRINSVSDLDIAPAYAMTVHRSQGSEYDTVLFLLPNKFYTKNRFLNRNLLYTALSRAKKRVIVYGREDVLVQMMRTDRKVRKSLLPMLVEHCRSQQAKCA